MHADVVALAAPPALERRDISRPSRQSRLVDADETRHTSSVAWLSRFVEDFRAVELAGTKQFTRLPDGRTNLVFRAHDGERTGDLTISGPRTRAYSKTASGIARWVTIELKRGWS